MNPVGEIGIFAHEQCGGKPLDDETKRISDLIHTGGRDAKQVQRSDPPEH